MQLLDFITIAVFAAGVVIMGLSFSGKSRNMKSFFAAGGAVPWPMSGLSLFMGFFSAGTFVVWGSIAYTSGWVSVAIQWTMALAGFAVGLFIAPRWHKTGLSRQPNTLLTGSGRVRKKFILICFCSCRFLRPALSSIPLRKSSKFRPACLSMPVSCCWGVFASCM